MNPIYCLAPSIFLHLLPYSLLPICYIAHLLYCSFIILLIYYTAHLLSCSIALHMHKDPTYLGLFADDGKAARKTVKNYCRESLIQLSNIQENVAEQLASFEEWTFPQDAHHVTTVFVGGKAHNLKQREREIFKTFPQDEKAMINIELFVYVPGYLMVGYCRSIEGFECANEHAHVTLMLKNKAKAFQSNEVLETLFRKYPDIAKGVQFQSKCLEVPWREHKVMYVVNRPLQLKAISGSNFKYGNK